METSKSSIIGIYFNYSLPDAATDLSAPTTMLFRSFRAVFDLESYDSDGEVRHFLNAITLDIDDESGGGGGIALTPGLVYDIRAEGYPSYDDFDEAGPNQPDFSHAEFNYTFQNSRKFLAELMTNFEVCRLYR